MNVEPINYLPDISALDYPERVAELLHQVDAEICRLRELGDFSNEIKSQLRAAFLPERISDTLNIENINVDPRITRAVMEGQALDDSDRYHENEVANAISANDFALDQADHNSNLDVPTIREIHRRMMESLISEAGAFRQVSNRITGAKFETADWTQILSLMEGLCAHLNGATNVHGLVKAAWAHAVLEKIHPFVDGNGRTGRLVQDYILVSHGMLPVGIPMGHRSAYYEALKQADGGSFGDLIHLVATAQLAALEKTIRIAHAPAERLERVRMLVRKSRATLRNTDFNRYELWLRQVDALKDEFRRWIFDFNREADDIFIRIHPSNPLSFEKWSEISRNGWARANWVMTMTVLIKGSAKYSICLYASRHNYNNAADIVEIPRGTVSIMLTGAEEDHGKYSYNGYSDPYIRLRELLYLNSSLMVYRDQDGNDDRWVADDSSSVSDVVEEFLTDLLGKMGLLA